MRVRVCEGRDRLRRVGLWFLGLQLGGQVFAHWGLAASSVQMRSNIEVPKYKQSVSTALRCHKIAPSDFFFLEFRIQMRKLLLETRLDLVLLLLFFVRQRVPSRCLCVVLTGCSWDRAWRFWTGWRHCLDRRWRRLSRRRRRAGAINLTLLLVELLRGQILDLEFSVSQKGNKY